MFVVCHCSAGMFVLCHCRAAGGELFRYIESDERLGEATVVRIMSEVVEGLAFLHEHNIVNMDVKVCFDIDLVRVHCLISIS